MPTTKLHKIIILLLLALFMGCSQPYSHHSVYRGSPNTNTALWTREDIRNAPSSQRRAEMIAENEAYTVRNSREAARTAKEWAYEDSEVHKREGSYKGNEIFTDTINRSAQNAGDVFQRELKELLDKIKFEKL